MYVRRGQYSSCKVTIRPNSVAKSSNYTSGHGKVYKTSEEY